MALTTLSVAVSVLVLKVHYMSPRYAVPGWVRRMVLGRMASVLCMDVNSGSSSSSVHHRRRDYTATNDKVLSVNSLAPNKNHRPIGAFLSSCLMMT